jgi:hypothetical protein
VRLIGLYLSYLAIVALFGLVSSIWLIFSVPAGKDAAPNDTRSDSQVMPIPGITRPEPTPARTVNKAVDAATDEAKREIFKLIMWYVFLALLEGGIGIYFLFWGGILFNLLNRENKPGEIREREPESILLNLSD